MVVQFPSKVAIFPWGRVAASDNKPPPNGIAYYPPILIFGDGDFRKNLLAVIQPPPQSGNNPTESPRALRPKEFFRGNPGGQKEDCHCSFAPIFPASPYQFCSSHSPNINSVTAKVFG